MKLCSVEGCGKPSRSKGMCKSHYDAQWRPGYEAANSGERKAYYREYRERNKGKIALRRRDHIEQRKAYDRTRYQEKKEEVKRRVREYAEQNRAKVTESRAFYYKTNAERVKQRVKEYRLLNRDKTRLKKAAGRERERNAPGAHDYMQLKTLRDKQRDRCAICCAKLNGRGHKDHIIPLVAGGTNWIDNIQWLCATCNTQKNRKDPITFMQQMGFLL